MPVIFIKIDLIVVPWINQQDIVYTIKKLVLNLKYRNN